MPLWSESNLALNGDVVGNFLNRINDSGVMVSESCRWLLEILIYWTKWCTSQLQNLSVIDARSVETLNIKVVENFINSLKRVETPNFDIGRRNHEGLKLVGLLRYDLEFKSILYVYFGFQSSFLDAIWMYDAMQYVCPIRPHQKKSGQI
jgi:hypothetical protein